MNRMPNEDEVPLLPANEQQQKQIRALPWSQLSIILFAMVCSSTTDSINGPFITQLIGDLDVVGGDNGKIGYYLGVIGTCRSAIIITTILYWNRLSDRIGRKPVFLIGMLASIASMLGFGLSRTFVNLLASTIISPLFNGNAGVIKSIIGEITDASNQEAGFAWLYVAGAIGSTIGPFVGGTLAKPTERFPKFFSGDFWRQYPYFLPCLVAATLVFTSFLITMSLFKESLLQPPVPLRIEPDDSSSPVKRVPLKQLFTYPILIAIGNNLSLTLQFLSHRVLLTLFFALPVQNGGLGLDPPAIGIILGTYHGLTGIFMATCFSKLVYYISARRVVILGMCSSLALWILLPVINYCASQFPFGVKIGIALILIPEVFIEMAAAAMSMFITSAAPTRNSLGSVNGLTLTFGGVAQALGPSAVTSLFSFSVERDLMGGYAVYFVLFIFSCFSIWCSMRLPRKVQPLWEQEDIYED